MSSAFSQPHRSAYFPVHRASLAFLVLPWHPRCAAFPIPLSSPKHGHHRSAGASFLKQVPRARHREFQQRCPPLLAHVLALDRFHSSNFARPPYVLAPCIALTRERCAFVPCHASPRRNEARVSSFAGIARARRPGHTLLVFAFAVTAFKPRSGYCTGSRIGVRCPAAAQSRHHPRG